MLRRSFKGKEKSPAPWYIKFTYFRISTKRTCSFGQIRYFLKYALQGYCILVNTKGFFQHLNQCRIFSLTKAIVGAGAKGEKQLSISLSSSPLCKTTQVLLQSLLWVFSEIGLLAGGKTTDNHVFYLRLFTFFFL